MSPRTLGGSVAERMSARAQTYDAPGASAARRGHPLERLCRDARCGALRPATSDVCAGWLGARAVGDDPDEAPRW